MVLEPIVSQGLFAELGLDPDSVGQAKIEQAFRSAMRRSGCTDPAAYRQQLVNSADERAELIEELVVPETWFFRNMAPFEYLGHAFIPRWMKRSAGQVLRVLSMPCSTGEEPYSIVMCLRQAGVPAERIKVLAVDISRRALEAARAGCYATRSFREPMPTVQQQFFTQEGETFHVASDVRDCVTFRHANLVQPGFLPHEMPFDVIFCRNLLIYLTEQARNQVLAHINRLLAPNGVLFTGHAEVVFFQQRGYQAVPFPRAFAIARAPVRARPASPTSMPSRSFAPAPMPSRSSAPSPPSLDAAAAAPAVSAAPPSEHSALHQIRLQADLGNLAEANIMCAEYREHHPEQAEGWYLAGVIQAGMGDNEQAQSLLARALYLDPEHEEVLAHLELLARERGDHNAAERYALRITRVRQRMSNKESV